VKAVLAEVPAQRRTTVPENRNSVRESAEFFENESHASDILREHAPTWI
jgi:hypothetical protein